MPTNFSRSLRRHLPLMPLLVALVGGCSPTRAIEAAGLLVDIAGQETPEAVPRVEVAYPGDGQGRRAHLYVPSESEAALVLVPGAAEEAMEDPRLIAFADALRRRRFLVLVPELAGEDPLQVSARDIDAIADAVECLTAAGNVDEFGMAALSYAVGPTIRAALRDDIRGKVGFVVSIGGYHSIVAGIAYLTTGAFREGPGAPWRYGEVDRRAKWVFLRANSAWISDPEDARRLEEIARARRARPGADVSALAARLGPEARAVYRVFVNDDPERVPELIAALPERIRAEIHALDLAGRDLGRLDADLILIHGRNDPLVPYTESLSLARAVGPEQSSLYLLEDLEHVALGVPDPADLRTLLSAAYRLLAERDAAPAPSPREPYRPAGSAPSPDCATAGLAAGG